MSSGSPFVPVVFYSIVAAGGIFSGASISYRSAELVRQIKDAEKDLKLLICTAEYETITIEAAKACGIPMDRILVMDYSKPRQWTLRVSSDQQDVLELGRERSLDWERITDLT